jgi:Cu-processing system ATP-binding protein
MLAIDMEQLHKRYPNHHALRGVTLRIPAGTMVALLGHNGAGKTTLMKLVLGLTRPSEGSLRVLGVQPADAGLEFRQHVGFLAENVAFHEEMTGRDTLRFYGRLKRDRLTHHGAILDRVGLSHAADRRVRTYSKGMRQRLGLAQALLGQPRLLLLDEPTTGLDPVLRQEFFRIIQELRDGGATVILSSHVLTELEARTDLVAILRQGMLMACGSLDQLREDADLPLRIRLTVPERACTLADALVRESISRDVLAGVVPHATSADQLELAAPLAQKVALVGYLTHYAQSHGIVMTDIELRPPTLDDVYHHYDGTGEQE